MPAEAGIQDIQNNQKKTSGFPLPAFAGTGFAGMTRVQCKNSPVPQLTIQRKVYAAIIAFILCGLYHFSQ